MMNNTKLNFTDFEEVNLTQGDLNNIKGGECTGGGFQRIGGGMYVSWESDETSGGCTEFFGVTICE